MIPIDDHKRLFLDMQEHPENYSDQQLETMMDELDRDLDATAAWQRFVESRATAEPRAHTKPSLAMAMGRRVAIIVGVLFLTGIAIAAWRASRPTATSTPTGDTIVGRTDAVSPSAAVVATTFDNISLDSILSVVAPHYGKAVSFRDEKLRSLKLIMTWESDAPLADFLDRLNAFDGLNLSVEGDTIVVESATDSSM